jgi:hypothetical protein
LLVSGREADGKRVWLYSGADIIPTAVTLGLSDGQMTELVTGDVPAGTAVVTSVNTTATPVRAVASAGLFMPSGGMGGPAGGRSAGSR